MKLIPFDAVCSSRSFTKPDDNWAVRMRTNVGYYKGNYTGAWPARHLGTVFTLPATHRLPPITLKHVRPKRNQSADVPPFPLSAPPSPAILVLMVIFSILTNPFLLFSLLFVSAGWGYVLAQKNPQPITIGGKTLTPFEQKASLAGFTLVAVMITGLSSTLFWALGVSTVLCGAHSVCHTTEYHIVDGDEFSSAEGAPGPAQA